MPAGRPSEYKPEYCQMLIDHMAKGMSFETFGHTIGHALSTTQRWVERFKEFQVAKERAFDASRVFWEEQAVKGLWTDKEGPQLNNTIWIFNMKNRFGWRDRSETEHHFKPQLKENEGKSVHELLSETEQLVIEAKKEAGK